MIKKKDEKMVQLRAQEAQNREDQNRKLQERKLQRVHITGIKRQFVRSEKPKQMQMEVKKVDLSEEQIDIQRYLGLQLSDAEERKQRGQ